MSSFEVHDVAINIELYKLLRFYHVFDPSYSKIFGFHFYRFTGILITVFIQSCVLFGLLGCFMEMEDQLDYIELFLFIFVNASNFLSVMKICVFIYKANDTWDLFEVARIQFLKSERCRKYRVEILEKVRNKSIKLTNFIFGFSFVTSIIWMTYPLVINLIMIATDQINNQRYQNVFNMRYPVTINTYNQYYFVFYAIEVILAFFILYNSILIDTFLVSFCWVIIAQYEILTEAFGNIGYEDKFQNRKFVLNFFYVQYLSFNYTKTYRYLFTIIGTT